MILLLYPLRPILLILSLATSFLTWLLFYDIFSFLLAIYFFPLVLTVLVYFKYLFLSLERIAHGYTDSPYLSFDFYKPFTEMRPYLLLMIILFILSMSSWFFKLGLDYLIFILNAYFLCTLPAFIGLLGIHKGFFYSLNPSVLFWFIKSTGLPYYLMLTLVGTGAILLNLLYRSEIGLFTAIFINYYFLALIFCLIGKTIYVKRNELDFRADNSPERAAEKAAEALLKIRKKNIERVFKERRRENVLAVLLTHIDAEQDKLAAHSWYHSEMMQWESKKLALRHAVFYINSLRSAGKGVLADLIEKECRIIDPDFTSE